MNLLEEIKNYTPANEQEQLDKEQMLAFMQENDNCLTRENTVAHFTVSVWTVNKEHTKVLMVYHNIYDSWAWVGGYVKKGAYVSSHLHFNVTYLAEADEAETLVVKEDENQGVKWFTFEEALKASMESWMVENVYKKLIEKI